MYLVHTNVVSELRKQKLSDENVLNWFAKQSTSNLFLSVISIMEFEQGYLKLQRHDIMQAARIRAWIDEHVLESFRDRILSVDTQIALCCARLHVPNRKAYGDALIAATAIVHNLTVVTRNVPDFAETGCKILNPWTVP
jgi:toxin FitB